MAKQKTFFKFLAKRGVLAIYVSNWRNARGHQDKVYKNWFNQQNEGDLIMNAFTWNKTPEGSSYWGRIHGKWHEEIFLDE